MYALFHHDRQISKAHSTRLAAIVEAFERRAVNIIAEDWRYRNHVLLADGYEIKEETIHGNS